MRRRKIEGLLTLPEKVLQNSYDIKDLYEITAGNTFYKSTVAINESATSTAVSTTNVPSGVSTGMLVDTENKVFKITGNDGTNLLITFMYLTNFGYTDMIVAIDTNTMITNSRTYVNGIVMSTTAYLYNDLSSPYSLNFEFQFPIIAGNGLKYVLNPNDNRSICNLEIDTSVTATQTDIASLNNSLANKQNTITSILQGRVDNLTYSSVNDYYYYNVVLNINGVANASTENVVLPIKAGTNVTFDIQDNRLVINSTSGSTADKQDTIISENINMESVSVEQYSLEFDGSSFINGTQTTNSTVSLPIIAGDNINFTTENAEGLTMLKINATASGGGVQTTDTTTANLLNELNTLLNANHTILGIMLTPTNTLQLSSNRFSIVFDGANTTVDAGLGSNYTLEANKNYYFCLSGISPGPTSSITTSIIFTLTDSNFGTYFLAPLNNAVSIRYKLETSGMSSGNQNLNFYITSFGTVVGNVTIYYV